MSVLSVVADVCLAVGVTPPASLFAANISPRTQLELRSLLNEMGQRIAYDTREWTALKATATFIGDGVKTSFLMPQDYQRMLLTSEVRPHSSPRQPYRFISDSDQWLARRLENNTDALGEWTLIGKNMHIAPTLPFGAQVSFAYLVKNCFENAAGDSYSSEIMADDNKFRLPERLLKLGMIWQWKANKGSPYAEDMGTYSDAILMAMGADKPAPVMIGHTPISHNAEVAYQGQVPS